MLQKQWAGLVWPASEDAVRNPETGVNQETLVKVGKASVDVPEDFVSRVFDVVNDSGKCDRGHC